MYAHAVKDLGFGYPQQPRQQGCDVIYYNPGVLGLLIGGGHSFQPWAAPSVINNY